MAYSVVIPSKNIENLTACVCAIREAGETCRVIVVDDGCADVEQWKAIHTDWPVWWVAGISPFVFARNVNIGIRAAGTDDVLVCDGEQVALLVGELDTELGDGLHGSGHIVVALGLLSKLGLGHGVVAGRHIRTGGSGGEKNFRELRCGK